MTISEINHSEELPLNLKSNSDVSHLYCREVAGVSVIYCIYDKKKKIIVSSGNSRVNGKKKSKITSHAEELAIKYCNKYDKKNKYEIYIWRFGFRGNIKSKTCCKNCTKLAKKLNYDKKIYTFKNGEIISAIIDDPEISLGNMLRNK